MSFAEYPVGPTDHRGDLHIAQWARAARLSLLLSGHTLGRVNHALGDRGANNGSYAASSGAHEEAVLPGGLGVVSNPAPGAASVNFANFDAFGNGDCTVWFVSGAAAGTSMPNIFAQGGAAGGIWIQANTDENQSNVAGQLCFGLLQTGVNRSSIKAASALDGTVHAYVVRKRGSTGQWWRDGRRLTTVVTGTLGGAPATATDTLRAIGDSTNGAFALPVGFVIGGIFRSGLTDRQCANLATLRGAWSPFEPRRIAVALPAGSAFTGSLVDSAAGTDINSAGVVFNVSLIDGATGADLMSATAVRAASLIDASTGADLLSAASTRAASLLDAAAGSDTASAGASLSATLLDGVTAADIQSAVATLQASLVDGATADDLRSATRIAAATVIDAAAGADINTTGTTFSRSLVDSARGADALQAAAIMVASLVDQASVTDQFNAAQQLTVLLTDAAAGSDLRSGSIPATYNVTLLDLAYALDVLSGVLGGGPLLVPSRSRGVDYSLAPLGVDYALQSQGVDCYAV
jgi:hypothetical protein